jgi:hypothetical protein
MPGSRAKLGFAPERDRSVAVPKATHFAEPQQKSVAATGAIRSRRAAACASPSMWITHSPSANPRLPSRKGSGNSAPNLLACTRCAFCGQVPVVPDGRAR